MLLSCRRWSSSQPTAAGKGPAKPPPTQGGRSSCLSSGAGLYSGPWACAHLTQPPWEVGPGPQGLAKRSGFSPTPVPQRASGQSPGHSASARVSVQPLWTEQRILAPSGSCRRPWLGARCLPRTPGEGVLLEGVHPLDRPARAWRWDLGGWG